MADFDTEEDESEEGGWMSDVQRAIALILIGSISFCTILSTIVVVFVTDPNDALVDMSKTLQAAVVNMTLIALGFFFGSSMAKTESDAGQQKIMEKLTSSKIPVVPQTPATPSPQSSNEPIIATTVNVETDTTNIQEK